MKIAISLPDVRFFLLWFSSSSMLFFFRCCSGCAISPFHIESNRKDYWCFFIRSKAKRDDDDEEKNHQLNELNLYDFVEKCWILALLWDDEENENENPFNLKANKVWIKRMTERYQKSQYFHIAEKTRERKENDEYTFCFIQFFSGGVQWKKCCAVGVWTWYSTGLFTETARYPQVNAFTNK